VLDGVKFKPSSGDDFALMVEVINVGEKNAEQLDLQSVLTNAAGSDLTNAVQQSLEIHDLAGPQVKGCYFVLMDKSRTIAAPKPGEYLFLTQGYARVANVILNFRLVSNHLAPEQDQALELIRTAKFAKMR